MLQLTPCSMGHAPIFFHRYLGHKQGQHNLQKGILRPSIASVRIRINVTKADTYYIYDMISHYRICNTICDIIPNIDYWVLYTIECLACKRLSSLSDYSCAGPEGLMQATLSYVAHSVSYSDD